MSNVHTVPPKDDDPHFTREATPKVPDFLNPNPPDSWDDVSETGVKRPPYVPTYNGRPIADYVQDWLAGNQIKDVRTIYHNPFPIGFVSTCIDRFERAEAQLREVEGRLKGLEK